MRTTLLQPETLRRLEQFQLLAQRRAKSTLRGERRSRARGQSVEFADFRNYTPGDDFRYLDWNLFGRLDRLFLKLYEEERELPVTILLDASESMSFGEPPKIQVAVQIAAAIGYVGLCGFDRVKVQVFPEEAIPAAAAGVLRSVRGRRAAIPFFEALSSIRAQGRASLNEALRRAAMTVRQTGMAVVLTDFLDPAGYEEGLKALVARGFQVNAIQVLAREEVNPTRYGDLRLVDSESGRMQEVTFGRYRLEAYQRTVAKFCQRLKEHCQGRGIRYFQTLSDANLDELLLKQLRQAEVWG